MAILIVPFLRQSCHDVTDVVPNRRELNGGARAGLVGIGTVAVPYDDVGRQGPPSQEVGYRMERDLCGSVAPADAIVVPNNFDADADRVEALCMNASHVERGHLPDAVVGWGW